MTPMKICKVCTVAMTDVEKLGLAINFSADINQWLYLQGKTPIAIFLIVLGPEPIRIKMID